MKLSLPILLIATTIPSLSLAQAASGPPLYAPQSPPAPAIAMPAPSAETAAVNASTGPIPADQLPPAQAAALAAGDNRLVTNGPIPDTPANRARFGGPDSHGGRKTPPVGD